MSDSTGSDYFNIVLVEPEIPPNTGNIARLCAVTRTRLHLVEPLGFTVNDQTLKRAGMDYWKWVSWTRWKSWTDFWNNCPRQDRCWFVESGGPLRYCDASYKPGDFLVFGRETNGLPNQLIQENPNRWLRIPMLHAEARSLNLANCAALVLFEALRQTGGFSDEV